MSTVATESYKYVYAVQHVRVHNNRIRIDLSSTMQNFMFCFTIQFWRTVCENKCTCTQETYAGASVLLAMFDVTQKQPAYNLNIRIQNMLWKNENNSEDKSTKLPPPLIDNDFTGNLLLSAAINQSQGGEIALSQDTTLFPFIQWENLYKKF